VNKFAEDLNTKLLQGLNNETELPSWGPITQKAFVVQYEMTASTSGVAHVLYPPIWVVGANVPLRVGWLGVDSARVHFSQVARPHTISTVAELVVMLTTRTLNDVMLSV